MQFYSSLNSDIEFEAPFEDLVTQVVNPANVLILLESSSNKNHQNILGTSKHRSTEQLLTIRNW